MRINESEEVRLGGIPTCTYERSNAVHEGREPPHYATLSSAIGFAKNLLFSVRIKHLTHSQSNPGWCWFAWMVLMTAFIFLSSAAAVERKFYFENLTTEQGLAQNSINAIFQDRTGFLWIGTQDGLHKYDGYKFSLFQHNADDPNSLPDSFITAIAEDTEGYLWIGSNYHYVSRLNPTTGEIKRYVSGPQRHAVQYDQVGALFFDPKNGVWVGSAGGIELLDPASGQHREIYRLHPESGQDVRVRDFSKGQDGILYAATGQGLLRVDTQRIEVSAITNSELAGTLSVLVAHNGTVYAGTHNGLFRVNKEGTRSEQVWPALDSPATTLSLDIIDLAEDARGRLWLASRGEGLISVDPTTGHSEWLRHDSTLPGTLPENSLVTAIMDRSGLLWLGTQSRGLANTNPNGAGFRYLIDTTQGRNPGTGNNIRAIYKDEVGHLWLSAEQDGLKRYDPATDRFDYFTEVIEKALGLKSPATDLRIFVIQGAGNNKLWVTTNQGALVMDIQERKARVLPVDPIRQDALPEKSIRSLLKASDESLWFGTWSSGLVHWRPKDNRWDYFRHQDDDPKSLSHNRVLSLVEDRSGRIWVGTLNGLNLYDPTSDRWRTFQTDPDDPHSLSGNLIRTIYQSTDETIWIGTHSGLNRLDILSNTGASFERYLSRQGLPNGTIYGILEDRHGKLWLSTNQGISAFDRTANEFRNFSLRDGLQGMEFNGGAYYQNGTNELFFGGLQGVNIFDPDKIEKNNYVPSVAITAVHVGREQRDVLPSITASGLQVAQAERVLHFEFAALDFTTPARNQFVYKLEGFDDNWTLAGTKHDATYTNLVAGKYVFHIKASNRDGLLSDQVTSLPLELTPVWWNSYWIKLIGLLLVALVAYLQWRAFKRKRARELHHHNELRQREVQLRLALWGSGDEFWDWDPSGYPLYRLGDDPGQGGDDNGEIVGGNDWRHRDVHPDDLALVKARLDQHVQGRTPYFESEHRIRNTDPFAENTWITVLARGKVVERDAEGNPVRICGTARDITATRQAERTSRIAAAVLKSMTEAVSVTDLNFDFIAVNDAFTRMTGYTESEVIGQSAVLLNCPQNPPEHYRLMREELMRNGHWRGEMWEKRKDGEEFLTWTEFSEVRDDHGLRTHYVCVLTDITDRKRTEQELRYLANYDPLTGLPNRALLSERLGQAIIRARRTNKKLGLLFIDLDRFKHVNDSMGHAAGDRMLKAVGARLRSNVRETDTVARLGGDEFTIILEDLVEVQEAEHVALKLLEAFTVPLDLENGQEVVTSPSIGISIFPLHAQTPSDLLKFSDTAMYQAKERGRNTYMLYTEAMDAVARRRATMVSALRKALERKEFSLLYQPKLSLLDNRVTGVEALLRWDHQGLGPVPPGTFIPLSEETGLIVEIGEYALMRACEQLAQWRGRGLTDLTMSVNISVLQLLRGALVERLYEIMSEYKITPDQIDLELTESMVMANAEHSIKILNQIKDLGITLSIDDFGTGYSSLSYLKRLPIHTLKIDKEFIRDLITDPDDEAITATMISMARSLNLKVIAEGVETTEQLAYLRRQGCDEIQGYWLSQPLSPDACFKFIQDYASYPRDLPEI